MRKYLLSVTLSAASFFTAYAQVEITEEHFPDPAFREYVGQTFDKNGDGTLSPDEISSAKDFYLYEKGIASLEGIQYFTSMELLNCSNNPLAELKLDGLPALENLMCSETELVSLSLSNLPSLTDLNCESSQLTELNLNNLPALTKVNCQGNQLAQLNFKDIPELVSLFCAYNQLSHLELGGFPKLQHLNCEGNQLTALDLSGVPLLVTLECPRNPLLGLDLSKNPNLTQVSTYYCRYPVRVPGGAVDTKTLPGFDRSKISNLLGGVWDGDYLYDVSGNNEITYDYATGYTGSGNFAILQFGITNFFNRNSPGLNELVDNSVFYDVDADGVKETYDQKYSDLRVYEWADSFFVAAGSLTPPGVNLPPNGYNLNNDGLLDFYMPDDYNSTSENSRIWIQQEDGNFVEKKGIVPYALDVDNDGRKDLFSYNSHDWTLHYQTADGAFTAARIDTLSRVQADSLLSQKWEETQNGGLVITNGIPSLRDNMFVRDGGVVSDFLFKQSLDVNRDGFIDLVGERTIFYNMGDNRFVAAWQPGKLTVKDLNGDYIPDYIYNDEEGQRVYTRVYQGGDNFEEQTLVSNLIISEMSCYDFDRDGDVDILFTFDYSKTLAYAFLMLCENDGNGHFTNHEFSYNDTWQFGPCRDYDNDGYMELLAAKQHYDEYNSESGLKDLYLFRLNNMSDILAPTEPVLRGYFAGKINDVDKTSQHFVAEDIDNDGYLDIQFEGSNGDEYPAYWAFASMEELLPGIKANEAPAKPSVPAFVADKLGGKLKLSWDRGSDKESSPVDLTYALRIGSAPGLDDIYFSEANADGSRRCFNDGNMGTNLDVALDVSKWKQGTYYISVQTVDPMHRGSAWSDELVYEHDFMKASFTLSDESVAPNDTLIISTSPLSDAFTRTWNLSGGRIIDASTDSSRLYVQFDTPGEKNISLTLTNTEGATDVYTMTVEARRAELQQISLYSGEIYLRNPLLWWDIDNNGTLDLLEGQGFYVNDGSGEMTKLAKIFNTNLSVTEQQRSMLLDFDMDGDADILTPSNLGDILINNGGGNFEGRTVNAQLASPYYRYGWTADLNNDGFLEIMDLHYDYIYKNNGDNLTSERVIDGKSVGSKAVPFDINRDGFVDIIGHDARYYYGAVGTGIIYLNKGNFEFEQLPYSINKDAAFLGAEDLNSDGYVDIVLQQNSKTIAVYWGNQENQYSDYTSYLVPVEIQTCWIQEMDNNGCPDILVSSADKGGAIIYMERDKSAKVEPVNAESWAFDVSSHAVDRDGDGVPDICDENYYTKVYSNIRNEAPKAPRNIRAIQEGTGILLQWDDAADKETPAMQMRYNVSVKKKGATGENAYIISPMNSLDEGMAIIPKFFYQKATQKQIPIDRFEVGQEYEVQIQSIDLWDAHSPMSEVYTFTAESQVGITGPNATCPNNGIELVYRGTEDLSDGAVWDWDGGKLLSNEGNTFEVYWETAGLKTVKVTINGIVSTKPVYVKAATDLSFDFPETGLAGTEITFMLPEAFANAPEEMVGVETSDNRIVLQRRVGSREAKAIFPSEGIFRIELQMEDSLCGALFSSKEIRIIGEVPTPVIDLVGIDAATGKNKVTWSMPGMPEYVTTVNIYKEGGKYNQFDSIAAIDPSAGVFIDMASNPSVKSERYQIRLGTTFGVESPASRTHSGTHLMLNRGMGSAINLIWNQYEGGIVDSYRILRGTSRDNLQLLAEVSGANTAYTDLTGGDGVYFYALEYDKTYSDEWQPLSVSLMAEGDEVGRSNVVCTDDALLATLAENMNILSLESEKVLTPSQPELHLSAEIFPVTADIRGVNWQIVSGSELATINQNGLLSSLGEENGEIVVRATAIDGSGIYAELTVEKKDFLVRPSSIVITTESGINTLTPEAPALQLLAEVQPAEASQAVTWSIVSGNELAAISDDGLLTSVGFENGTIIVRATSVTAPEVYQEFTVEKKDFVDTGISGIEWDEVRIWVKGDLYVSGLPTEGKVRFRIIDMLGLSQLTASSEGVETARIELGRLASGTYILLVETKDGSKTFRFIK